MLEIPWQLWLQLQTKREMTVEGNKKKQKTNMKFKGKDPYKCEEIRRRVPSP